MIYKTKDTDYRISFKHGKNGTICDIHSVQSGGKFKDDGVLVATGASHRNPVDRPCKEVGRKVSMTRAVKGLPIDLRRALWKTYLGRKS